MIRVIRGIMMIRVIRVLRIIRDIMMIRVIRVAAIFHSQDHLVP